MNCTNCGTLLAPDARFCARCGMAVARSCATCGNALDAGARFCAACGTAVGGSDGLADAIGPSGPTGSAGPSGPTGRTGTAPLGGTSGPSDPGRRERKVATIVFADIVGFTALNEAYDPELVQGVVFQAFERLSGEVARYEGLVEKFAGDAMLAVFGVPVTHEDDPERAVRAALEMQAALTNMASELRAAGRPELELRIGIEAGEVLVDQARAAGERDRMVTGDAVNTAARLQAAAAPGTVVVGPSAYAATRTVVEYRELEPLTLKGKALPVAAWQATAVKARRGGQRARSGLEAPLIGRDEEMGLLKDTIRRTVAQGRPHLVTVVAAAGVGKSRLTWELEKYLDGLPEPYHWRKGRCLAYAQASYAALAEVVRADARIAEDDTPEDARRKLDERLAAVLADSAHEGAIREALHALLGLAPARDIARERLWDAWRRHLESIARLAPLVLVLEDIHWADDGLLDVAEYLARWAEAPIAILCLARHELRERRPGWGGGIPDAASIVLQPLTRSDNDALVSALIPGLPEGLRERVVALADGNALFTEELVRMFVDRGILRFGDGRWQVAGSVDELEIPGSIQAVLAARLDSLPAVEKRAAQDASVVGRIFWDQVLGHLVGRGTPGVDELLLRLRVKELVVPREPSSLAGASEYGFRHVLIRDVAYDSLAKRDRAAKHLAVARWAEAELASRGEEASEMLASHYHSALRYAEEFATWPADDLAEVRRLTLRYATLAGERAARLAVPDVAARWLLVALELARRLGVDPRERSRLAETLLDASLGGMAFDTSLAVARDAVTAIRAIPDPSPADHEREARLVTVVAFTLFSAGKVDEGRQVLQDALDARQHEPPTAGRAALLARLGWLEWRSESTERAIPILERALEDARAVGTEGERVLRWATHDLGIARAYRVPGTGLALVRESWAMARAAGDIALQLRCFVNVTSIMLGSGEDWDAIAGMIEEGLILARRRMDRAYESWLLQQRMDLYEAIGRIREAIADGGYALSLARALGDVQQVAGRLGSLAWLHWRSGDISRARDLLGEKRETGAVDEPQNAPYFSVLEAWDRWQTDPVGATRALAGVMPSLTINGSEAGAWLARMTLRTGDGEALRQGVALARAGVWEDAGPKMGRLVRYLEALGRPPAEAAPIVEACAAEDAAAGGLTAAADRAADAALLYARAGLDATGALTMARGLYERMGTVPVLGALPEDRWIGAAAGTQRVATS